MLFNTIRALVLCYNLFYLTGKNGFLYPADDFSQVPFVGSLHNGDGMGGLAVLMDVLQRPSQVVNRITKRFAASLQQDILVWANFLLPRPYIDV